MTLDVTSTSLSEDNAVAHSTISPRPIKERELRIDGNISPNDIEAWKKFISQPMHERLLQLHWISRNRSELAVLWTFCEHHRRTATLGEKYFRRDSRRLITSKLSDRIHCTEVGVSKSINALIEEGVLGKQEHVDNVIRKLWLNWPALSQRLKIDFPDQQVLQFNWLAENSSELCVLNMLAQHWLEVSSNVDDVRTVRFVKVTLKTIQPHAAQLGMSTNAKSVERAVAKLNEAGLIELSDQGVMNKARLNSEFFKAMEDFLATNFENGLW
jgi:predicted transcriptional regulator